MVTYLLKKSYQHRTYKEINFKDLWGDKGVFTTMWIFGKPAKIIFFKEHIKNLVKSLEKKAHRANIEKDILKLIRLNIDKNKSYNHLLRVAVNKKIISVSLRDRKTPKLKFNLKLINHKRIDPELKNLKYKLILKHLVDVEHHLRCRFMLSKKNTRKWNFKYDFYKREAVIKSLQKIFIKVLLIVFLKKN